MRTIAFRRHQDNKKKAWVKKHFTQHWIGQLTPTQVGRTATSPTPCSCYMCGNPRKHYGNSNPHKISELKVLDAMSYVE